MPERCHRVRYEDLAADPERVAANMFEFLGVRSAPGRTASLASGQSDTDGQAGVPWQIVGRSDVWDRVIRGTTNLNVALRRRDLRYSSAGDAALGATRMSMFADLLGVTSWRSAEQAQQSKMISLNGTHPGLDGAVR